MSSNPRRESGKFCTRTIVDYVPTLSDQTPGLSNPPTSRLKASVTVYVPSNKLGQPEVSKTSEYLSVKKLLN